MSAGRAGHEETATDRWTGALLESARMDPRSRVDALVDRAVARLRPATGARHLLAAWRTPLAAAASVALVAGAALLFSPQPASASALLRAAQRAEAATGDRRFSLELAFPPRPGGGAASAPRATGTLDVRDNRHVRLDLRFDDGRTMVRAMDGGTSWTIAPDGTVLRVPGDAPWPRFVETPEGELLADRLDVLLADVGAHYRIERCDSGGEVRLCATLLPGGFRGAERIELALDPATKEVRRAEFRFTGPEPRRGEDVRPEGPPHGGPPHGGRRPEPRHPRPTSMVIERVALPEGGLGADRFSPPSPPVEGAGPDGRPVRRRGS